MIVGKRKNLKSATCVFSWWCSPVNIFHIYFILNMCRVQLCTYKVVAFSCKDRIKIEGGRLMSQWADNTLNQWTESQRQFMGACVWFAGWVRQKLFGGDVMYLGNPILQWPRRQPQPALQTTNTGLQSLTPLFASKIYPCSSFQKHHTVALRFLCPSYMF